MIMNPDKSNSILFATTQRAHFLCQHTLSFQFHSVTILNNSLLCTILVLLFLNISRPSQKHVSITFGPLNKFVVHLIMKLSALLPLLLSLLDSIMLTPFYMAFQLNTFLVSSVHKIALHALSQVLASPTPAHPH